MKAALMIILTIASVVLIVSILFQSGSSKGLSGSIAGGAEQLFGSKKAKGYDAILSKVTIAGAIIFIVSALILVTLE